jgi:hypothetical protein
MEGSSSSGAFYARYMSESSPADLAVTFRSIGRRLREALAPAGGDPSAAGQLPEYLDAVVATAAHLMGTAADANMVADAIQNRHPEDWSAADLTQLRANALEAGRLLRQIAGAVQPNGAGDDNDD